MYHGDGKELCLKEACALYLRYGVPGVVGVWGGVCAESATGSRCTIRYRKDLSQSVARTQIIFANIIRMQFLLCQTSEYSPCSTALGYTSQPNQA